MDAREIVEVVGEIVPDDGAALEQEHGPRALVVAQQLRAALAPRLEGNPMYAMIWQQFQAAPEEKTKFLVLAVEELLQADAALARRLDTLLAEYRQARDAPSTTISTGGGAYIGGSVKVGRDFVGRDQTVITGDGNVVGDHSSATVVKIRQAPDPGAVARAFRDFYAAVEAHPDIPPQEQADLQAELQELEQEVAKGGEADEGFLARRLRNVGRMAPDILEVVLATFANPAAGLGLVAKKVADRIKATAEGAEGVT